MDRPGILQSGRPGAPAVVFLHGIGGAARGWQPQLDSFAAAGFRAVALDLPGYGARLAVTAMTFDALAADLEATVDVLKLNKPVLVGHSMGGMIAQTALRRRPDGYGGAVLVGTSPAFGNPAGDFQKKFVADRLSPIESGKTMAELAPAMVDGMMGPSPEAGGRTLVVSLMSDTPVSTYRAAVLCLVTFDERANLANIRVPVLCLVGENDRNAPPPVSEKMASKIPGGHYVCLPGLGHLPNLEAPKAFDAAVLPFLKSVTMKGRAAPLIP
jgi:pimeloyl-ACP methyl ester carboxylesterase